MSAKQSARPAVTSGARLVMLLSLVGFLRERDGVPVAEVAERFNVSPDEVRELVTFLGTAGVPGETLSYQHEDLFDIDWYALEAHDEVRLTQVIAVDDAPRFAPAETAALIAGLHALTPLLPVADAAKALSLSAKLARALGGPAAALSLEQGPADPRVTAIFEALREGRGLRFGYRDASGNQTMREVNPISLQQDGDAWYLLAFCLTRRAERSFRVAQITALRTSDTHQQGAEPVGGLAQGSARSSAVSSAVSSAGDAGDIAGDGVFLAAPPAPAAQASSYELIATVPAESLWALDGFAPRVVSECVPGILRVAIEGWHDALALQLMRIAPGRIVIESPARARAAVSQWANLALAAYDA